MDGSCRWCITHNGYFDYHLGPTYMNEAEYNNKVAEAALAYLHKIITYDEWYLTMAKLIERKRRER